MKPWPGHFSPRVHRSGPCIVGPNPDTCNHSWKRHTYLNGGFYHHGAIQRDGFICQHCAQVCFDDTDAEAWAKLPEWMRQQIPEQDPAFVAVAS